MSSPNGTVGRGFWLRWVIASSVGSGAGVLLWVAVGSALEAMGMGRQGSAGAALLAGTAGAAFGIPFGAGQWLVLRRHVEYAGRWVWASAVGYAVVFLLGNTFLPGGEAVNLDPAPQVLLGAALGAAVAVPASLLQWLVVLRRQFPGAVWWIPASVLSWAVGFAISFALRLWLGELTFIAGPVVSIALSGLVIVRLLQRRNALAEDIR